MASADPRIGGAYFELSVDDKRFASDMAGAQATAAKGTESIAQSFRKSVGAVTGLIGAFTAVIGVATTFYSIGNKIGEALFTELDLKRKLREARRTLEDHIPQRAQFIAAKQQITKQAHERFPFLTDKQSAEYQMAEQGRRNPQYAALMAMPNAEWILGVLVILWWW